MALKHHIEGISKELEANHRHIEFLQYGITKAKSDLQEINQQINHLKKEASVVTMSEYKYLQEGRVFRINEIQAKIAEVSEFKARIEDIKNDIKVSERRVNEMQEATSRYGKLLEFSHDQR